MRKKRKYGKIFSALQNGAIRGLQIGGALRGYKSGQERLEIGAALGILNRGRHFKLGQRLQVRVRRISNWCITTLSVNITLYELPKLFSNPYVKRK